MFYRIIHYLSLLSSESDEVHSFLSIHTLHSKATSYTGLIIYCLLLFIKYLLDILTIIFNYFILLNITLFRSVISLYSIPLFSKVFAGNSSFTVPLYLVFSVVSIIKSNVKVNLISSSLTPAFSYKDL